MLRVLVSYDDGTGGAWAYVMAPSAEDVRDFLRRRFPAGLEGVEVHDSPPVFWSEAHERGVRTYDSVDHLARDWPGIA